MASFVVSLCSITFYMCCVLLTLTLDVQEKANQYTPTFCYDRLLPHGIVYNLQYSYDETCLYSIGKRDEFFLLSELSTTSQPETKKSKIRPGAVFAENTEERIPVCGQIFSVMPRKKYVLTSSHAQGIVYEVFGDNFIRLISFNHELL